MHEISLLLALIDMVREKLPDRTVRRVRLEVGRLAMAQPELLRSGWEVCRRGTPLEAAELELQVVPGQALCRACSRTVRLDSALEPCPLCGSYQLEWTSGRDLRIVEIEVDEDVR
ncbi:MAG: hydrogenase maturation nickel metallochaperone HypA [Candidatus Eremiobacterota bacterium]